MGERKLIELAAKYAEKKGRMQMSNKINKLLDNFTEMQREQRETLEENSFHEISVIHAPTAAPIIQEASTPIIAPKIMTTHRNNPFKKVSNISKTFNTPPNPINHLSKKAIGMHSTSIKDKDSDDENTPKNNISSNNSTISNKSLSADTPRPGNYAQWFIANKDSLQKDFPDASDIELTRHGKARYKELTMKNTSNSESLNDSELVKNSSKRKLNVSTEGGIAKLSKFGYDNE